MQVLNGACPVQWSARDHEAEGRVLAKYIPWEYERLRDVWRAIASR